MSKYKAKRTNGYASKREAARAVELSMLEQAGVICGLTEQVSYELIPKDELGRTIRYVADFVYLMDGCTVIEDVKGFRTEVYKLKRRMMFHKFGIKIREI